MKIQLASDLHLEFYPDNDFPLKNAGDADVLILAGDIMPAPIFQKARPFFERCARRWKNVVYVLGNHEHYRSHFQETGPIIWECFNAWGLDNVHLLDQDEYWVNGIPIWGGTMWTDCNGGDRETKEVLARSMNDFRLIRYGAFNHMLPTNAIEEFCETLATLDKFLRRYKDVEQMVVVTHHAPSFRSVQTRYIGDHKMNGGYASNLDAFITRYPQIKLWCHGHMHGSNDYKIGKTRVVSNAAGYPQGWVKIPQKIENLQFNPRLLIELEKEQDR